VKLIIRKSSLRQMKYFQV